MKRCPQSISAFLRRNRSCLLAAACMLAVMLAAAMFTGQWATRSNSYNTYALQANAWLHGHLELVDGANYPWLELAIFDERFYVSFPPFPSYVLLPFAAVLGTNTPDGLIALFFAMLSAVYAARLFTAVTGSDKGLLPIVMYLLVGNGYLYLTLNGWVWFFAQNMCFALSLMALYYAYVGKGGWSLTFWACAVGCRPMVALYLPLLAYLICRRYLRKSTPEAPIGYGFWRLVRDRWYWAIVPLLIAASYMTLNALRFGNVLEFGHNYLPEFSREGATPQFSLQSLGKNLLEYLRLPELRNDGVLAFFALNGNGFYLVNPIFITALCVWLSAIVRAIREHLGKPVLSPVREKPLLLLLPVLIVLHILWVCCHSTLGAVQFGNRYLVDIMPYLYLGLLLHHANSSLLARYTLPLLYYGTSINLIGTVLSYKKLL